MKNRFLTVAAIVWLGSVAINHANACALRLPSFELTGFPISQHQVAVLGSAQVEENPAEPTLTLAGMPASPHQIAVLTPRLKSRKIAKAAADPNLFTVGLNRIGVQTDARQNLCTSE
ncbi:hypothetical protein L6654_33885 [Bradyrhizobium sp. WYCCWR 13023]|uniref:Cyclic di-GMP-binding protein n=1 Tax=Bradyrhizobium zhengyangense TaxID=2911009 RepID=A0A9X1RGP5_9BRAD|nr:hypothetical protein [Bradyrhizobium zhengyangense]MCG2631631.1 hypothetical protein [Bradyrhizobium zhengyangense]